MEINMKSAKQSFLAEVERFIKKHKFKPTSFSTQFANSPKFVADLRNGRNVTLDTVDRMRVKMKIFETG